MESPDKELLAALKCGDDSAIEELLCCVKGIP
jgi:hypothetical protein